MTDMMQRYLSVAEVARLLAKDDTALLIDARTAEEFAEGHVPGAINVPINDLGEFMRNRDAANSRLFITMCGSTGRGEKAAALLSSLGVKDAAVLDGGLKAWKEAGHPVA